MKFKITLRLNGNKVTSEIIDMPWNKLPGIKGHTRTHIDNFKVEWKMLDTKENRKLRKKIRESLPDKSYMRKRGEIE